MAVRTPRPSRPSKRPLSEREYFALPVSLQPTDLIDGEVVVSPAPAKRHQLITFAGTKAIETFAEVHGGDMIVSPTDVHLATNVVLQPATGYVAPGGSTTFDDHVVGPPALIVEVLSPGTSTALHDRKMRKYALHGVPEAWVIDPVRSTVLVLRNEDGAWQESGRVTFGEDIPSPTVQVGDAGLAKFA